MTRARKLLLLAVTGTAAVVAIPATAFYLSTPGKDPLGDTLRDYSFLPIKPASNLMSVGSLYYVDSQVREFKAICHPDKSDLDGLVTVSRSWELQESLDRTGRFATDVKLDLNWVFGGSGDRNYTQKVQYSLTDVVLEEIPLGASLLIFAKLMERSECNQVAMQYVRAGYYVCQGQKLMQATAEFKLDAETQNKLTANGKVTANDIKDMVKLAVESQADQNVIERDGRLLSGTALKYGVSMNPMCVAPPDGRFRRVLPKTAFDRVYNFVLFNIVEPIFPGSDKDTETAEAPARKRG